MKTPDAHASVLDCRPRPDPAVLPDWSELLRLEDTVIELLDSRSRATLRPRSYELLSRILALIQRIKDRS